MIVFFFIAIASGIPFGGFLSLELVKDDVDVITLQDFKHSDHVVRWESSTPNVYHTMSYESYYDLLQKRGNRNPFNPKERIDERQVIAYVLVEDGQFAALKEDKTVVTWGHADRGGDSSSVKSQLQQVQSVYATANGAFAALKEDKTVVTWGSADDGGESSSVESQLLQVQSIYATANGAFAALKEDKTVMTTSAINLRNGFCICSFERGRNCCNLGKC